MARATMMMSTPRLGAPCFLENAQGRAATALLFGISDARKVALARGGYAVDKFVAAKALATILRPRDGFSDGVAVLDAIARCDRYTPPFLPRT